MEQTNQLPPTPPEAGMVQCEITGKWVPQDEIITIEGRQVCAEGKAELLDRLKSGERLPGELERPSVLRRLGAMIVDGIVMGVVNYSIGFLILGSALFGAAQATTAAGITVGFGVWQLGSIVILTAYYTLMHGKYGQTLGKMAVKIKVLNGNGSPISMNTAFLRFIYYNGPAMIGMIIISISAIIGSDVLVMVSGVINSVAGIYILVSAIMAIVDREQQRAIHDRLAKTRVVGV